MLLHFDDYYIEPINEKEYWMLCNFAVTNDDRLKAFFPKTLEQNLNPELSKLFAQKKAKQFKEKEEFLFTIKAQHKKTIVGLVYIKELDWVKQQGEFAYAISYEYEGKGVTGKAVAKLVDYAFKVLDLKTLQIIVHKTNIGSVMVAKKNNFIWQATLPKEYTPPNGVAMDMELYELYN